MLDQKVSVQPIEKVIETNGSRPVIVVDEQLDEYACKYDWPQKLIKEYIAHHFLEAWGLPRMPAAFVNVIPEHIAPANVGDGVISNRTQPRHFNKPCFGTLYNPNATAISNQLIGLKSDYNELRKYNNREDFLKIALFDLWLVNSDRNHGNYNMLIQPLNKVYVITPIDHSEIFDGFDIGDSLSQLTPESSILTSSMALVFLNNKRKIPQQVEALLNNFSNFVIKCGELLPELVDKCPDSWCSNKVKLLQDLTNFVEDENWIQETIQNFKELVQTHLIN